MFVFLFIFLIYNVNKNIFIFFLVSIKVVCSIDDLDNNVWFIIREKVVIYEFLMVFK